MEEEQTKEADEGDTRRYQSVKDRSTEDPPNIPLQDPLVDDGGDIFPDVSVPVIDDSEDEDYVPDRHTTTMGSRKHAY